jgi:hypothetical protein
MNLMLFQHLDYLDLVFNLYLKDFLISSCSHYLQLHRRPRGQAHFPSRQCHGWIRLPLK